MKRSSAENLIQSINDTTNKIQTHIKRSESDIHEISMGSTQIYSMVSQMSKVNQSDLAQLQEKSANLDQKYANQSHTFSQFKRDTRKVEGIFGNNQYLMQCLETLKHMESQIETLQKNIHDIYTEMTNLRQTCIAKADELGIDIGLYDIEDYSEGSTDDSDDSNNPSPKFKK